MAYEILDDAPSGRYEVLDEPQSNGGGFMQGVGNAAAGLVRGAGSIGATLLSPFDYAEQGIAKLMGAKIAMPNRRQGMDEGLQSMGAEPD